MFKETKSVIDGPYPSRGISKKPHEQKPDCAGRQATVAELQATYYGKPLVDVRWWMTHSAAYILKEG